MDRKYYYDDEKNQQSKLTFKSSPFKALQNRNKTQQMIFVQKQKQQIQSFRSSQLLLEESFQDIKQQSNSNAKLDYLISMKNQSNQQIVQLNRQIKSLRTQLKVCQRKINKSLKKNQYIQASLRKIKKTINKDNSFKYTGQKSRQQDIEDRYFDLGKFVRKNPYKKQQLYIHNEYNSVDKTKTFNNQTTSREQLSPKYLIKKSSDYFDPADRRLQQSDRLKLKNKKNKKEIKILRSDLDTLIYKQLKTVNKDEKKQIRKQIKQVSKKLDQYQICRQRTKCKCNQKKSTEFLYKN